MYAYVCYKNSRNTVRSVSGSGSDPYFKIRIRIRIRQVLKLRSGSVIRIRIKLIRWSDPDPAPTSDLKIRTADLKIRRITPDLKDPWSADHMIRVSLNSWGNSQTCLELYSHKKIVVHFFIPMLLLPPTSSLIYLKAKRFKGPKTDHFSLFTFDFFTSS